jgi:serine/threonine-protein kinase
VTDIPGYRLLRPIGRGGMASVFLAVQESLGREVALKLLVPQADADNAASERFLREARIAAGLHHPNIVPIFDFGVHEGTAYIAMAYEAGGTIAPMPGEKLPPRDALRLVRDVAAALEYAHARGVVHRDIKPENILRREDGAAMLSDFGIARLIEGGSVLTTEGTSVGTPHYMSPEQLRGDKVDGRSDLYSLGVVLWQLLTGELPYTGTDSWAIGTQHLGADIPRLPAELAHLQPLVDSLLAKRAEGRLQSGGELVHRIDALLSGQVTPETAPTLAVQGARRRREDSEPAPLNPAPMPRSRVLGFVAFALVVPLAFFGWRQFVRTPPATAPASRATTAAPAAGPAARAAPASIAVMAFEDLSASHDQAYFSDGIAEEVQGRLAQVPGLQVAGRASARSFKGKSATVAQIGKALGVDTVLEGTVRKDGERMRVAVQLSNVRTGFQIWTQSYDRKLTDVFAMQDDIAAAVVDALKPKLLGAGAPPATRPRHTPPFEAYDAYLRGRDALPRNGEGALATALAAYRKAVQIDPNYAEAWSGLAMAEFFQGESGGKDAQAAKARSHAAAERAVALNPTLGDAYATRGYLRTNDWQWAGAMADLQRAIALAPSDGRNQMRYAYLLITLDRLPEARKALEEGAHADPLLLPVWQRLAITAAALGDHEAARKALDHVAALDPEAQFPAYFRAVLDLLDGKAAAAKDAFRAVHDPVGEIQADFSLGNRDAARAGLRKLVADFPGQHFEIAQACAWIGDLDCAFLHLDAVVSAHQITALKIPYDPMLRNVRSDPRYATLLARMNLPIRDTQMAGSGQ